MTNLEKIEKVSELYKEIVEIFPDGYSSLMIHYVEDIKKLDEKIWKVKKLKSIFNKGNNIFYLTAERKYGKDSALILFSKNVKADI